MVLYIVFWCCLLLLYVYVSFWIMNRDGLLFWRKFFLFWDVGWLDCLVLNLEDDEDDGDLYEEEGEKDDEVVRLECVNDLMVLLLFLCILNDNISLK